MLAGRNSERLRDLARQLGGLEWRRADVSDPASVAALLEPADVLISTVGPFARWGEPAVRAAVGAGAHYLDCTGEGMFVRGIFERFGLEAQSSNCGLMTAFGADWIPGNLAGALALREAKDAARRIEIGYFITGARGAMSMSGGTRASAAGALLDPGFAWRDGRVVTERGAARVMSFDVDGRSRPGASVAASEHFTLPRLAPSLSEVDVYLGWFGPMTRPLQVLSAGASAVLRMPGAKAVVRAASERLISGSSGGPDAQERARTGLHAVAIVRDESGRQCAGVHVAGANAYDFTADMLAWGATTALAGGLRASGALGPVDGFGLEVLQKGCAEAGLHRV